MEFFTIVFVAGVFGILVGGISLKLRSKAFAKTVSSCPTCGKEVAVSPDPENSRLVLQCENGDCGETSYRQVRASAWGLFGLARLFLATLVVALSYSVAEWLGWNLWGRALATLGGLLMGLIVASFLTRLCAHALLKCCPSPILQSEIVAHLAPLPPFFPKGEMKATGTQRFIASGCLFVLWLAVFLVTSVVVDIKACEPKQELLQQWSYLLPFLISLVLSLLIGAFLAILVGLIVLTPIYRAQGLRNGGPFKEGDVVQIICSGEITRVYSGWQGSQVRVELGEEAKEKFKDIFYPAQLIRYKESK